MTIRTQEQFAQLHGENQELKHEIEKLKEIIEQLKSQLL